MAEDVILKLSTQVEGAQSIREFRQAIRDINAEMSNVPRNSAAFRDLQRLLAEATDGAGDLREEIRAIHPENLGQTFAKVGGTIAQGFAGAQAAAALFGEENENVQKAILKVQAATQIAQTIQSFSDIQKQAGILKNIALLRLEELEKKRGIVVTEGMTVAQRALNVVMSANPIGLIVAGLAALAVATYGIIKAFQDETKESEKLTTQLNALKASNELLNRELDREIALLEAQGAEEEKIIELKRKKMQANIEEAALATRIANQKVKEVQEEVSWTERILQLTGNTSAAEVERAQRVKDASNEAKKAREDELDAKNKAAVFEAEQEKKKRDEAKKQADEDAKKYKDDLQKQQEARRKALEAELADLQLLAKLRGESRSNELKQNEISQALAVEDATKAGRDTNLVVEQYRAEQSAINEKWNEIDADIRRGFVKELQEPEALPPSLLPVPSPEEFEEARAFLADGYARQRIELDNHYKELEEKNQSFYDKGLISLEQYEANRTKIQSSANKARMEMGLGILQTMLKQAQDLFEKDSDAYKAIAVANATIDTYKAANAAYAAMAGIPVVGPALGFISAGLAVAAGIKNVQAILAVKKGTTPSATGGGAASNAFASVNAAPSQGTPGFQTSTTVNPDGTIGQQFTGNQQQPQTLNANVVISAVEMTDMQNQITSIQETSKF